MSLLANIGRTSAKRLAPVGARALCQTEQIRQFAAAPATPAQDDDIVLQTFRESQQQFQQLMQGLQGITLPLTGDDAAIKRYAADVEALKAKIGMPDVEEVIQAELDYKFACSGSDVRKFVQDALDSMGMGSSMADAKADLLAALDEAEKAGGGELNEKGWQVLTAKLGDIERKHGLGDAKAVRDTAVFEMYKAHIKQLRTQVVDDVAKARTEDLADLQLDLAKLKPKLA